MRSIKPQLPKAPLIVSELSKLPVVRNMQPVTPNNEEFKFELTDGMGFEKTHYKVYILRDATTAQPVLTTILSKGSELFNSKFMVDLCRKYGLSARVDPVKEQIVLSMKLSKQKSNLGTFMKFYDFLCTMKALVEFRETINRDGKQEKL